jgi:hypothetical protein
MAIWKISRGGRGLMDQGSFSPSYSFSNLGDGQAMDGPSFNKPILAESVLWGYSAPTLIEPFFFPGPGAVGLSVDFLSADFLNQDSIKLSTPLEDRSSIYYTVAGFEQSATPPPAPPPPPPPPPPPSAQSNTLSNVIGTNSGLTATIVSGSATRDNTELLSGTRDTDVVVSIYDNGNFLSSSSEGGEGWSLDGTFWSFNTPALSDGEHVLKAVFTRAGAGSIESSVSLAVDTQATGTLSATALTDTGSVASVANGGSTTDRTLGLSGTAESGSTVQIFDGENLLGEASLVDGNWTYVTPALSDGLHALTARVTDAVGNVLSTEALNVTVTPPPPAFNIDIDYSGDSIFLTYFQQAAARWSSIITADIMDFDGVDDLRITASVKYIDGPGEVLAEAGPTNVRPVSALPYKAIMNFDSEDIPRLIANGNFDDVVLHEMGHALGLIGPIFQYLGLLDPTNIFQYTGANALAQYRSLSPLTANASFIPLETDGGPGTAGSHWSEQVFGRELLTGFINSGVDNLLSSVTVGAMEDLGYTVDYSKADAYSLPSTQFTAPVLG